jgi:hypothetical protein
MRREERRRKKRKNVLGSIGGGIQDSFLHLGGHGRGEGKAEGLLQQALYVHAG